MAKASRDFGGHNRPAFLESVPRSKPVHDEDETPWAAVHPNAMPPMMLDFCLRCGRVLSRPYSSIDLIDYRDAGHVQIAFMGLVPIMVTVEGRNLSELRGLLVSGRIRQITETDERDFERDEDEPAIDRITIEPFSRP